MNSTDKTVDVEVSGIPDCPNFGPTVGLVAEIAAELEIPVNIRQVTVHDETEALAHEFPGSPSVLIDGLDLEADTRTLQSAFGCRVYRYNGRVSGMPSAELIRSRLHAASSIEGPAQNRATD